MRASLNTCLQTDSQLNEGVENDVHGQKKVYNFRKKSIYILDTVSTARRWTERAPGWRPLHYIAIP